jgi:threonine dehydrogenase-like Zn-dependent dehydrogenase
MTTPSRMRAVVYRGDETVEVADLSVPALGASEVLVRVAYCGVCGTDLHLVSGHGGWGTPGSVYGHEWSGEVAAVGSSVTRWAVGDRVVGGERPCGVCEFCRSGRTSLCTRQEIPSGPTLGGFAEYTKEHEDALFSVADRLNLRAAALAEPLAVAQHGVTRSGAGVNDRVLVTGGGPIGLLTVAALRATGVHDVTVSEPVPARRASVARVGATAVTPEDLPPVSSYIGVVPDPFDVAIECSGNVRATVQALEQLRPGGRLVIVGSNFDTVPIDPLRVLVQEVEITGARQYDADGFTVALQRLADHLVPTEDLLEEFDTPFENFGPLVQQMRRGEIARKPLVVSA